MQLNEYQQLASRTAAHDLDDRTAITTWILGLTGESGEVADIWKKVLGHGHPIDKDKLIKEVGDVLWYVAMLSESLGFTLEEVAEKNIAKLKERYPEGFSTEKSLNRTS